MNNQNVPVPRLTAEEIAALPPRDHKAVSDCLLAINHHVSYLAPEECNYLHHVFSHIAAELCERCARSIANQTRSIISMADLMTVPATTNTEGVAAPI